MKKMLSFLLVFWIVASMPATAQYQNSEQGDLQALKDIYTATNGINWYNTQEGNKPWDINATSLPGSTDWFGVTTEVIQGERRVVHLDLQTGTHSITSSNSAPSSYGNNLNNAEKIDGDWELIPGHEFPESIGNLTKLRYLNVKHNTLRGPVPDGLTNLVSAERILLAGHPREPQYGSGTNAPYNHPTSTGIPSSEGVSKAAQALNFFEGDIPQSIGGLKGLKIFELAFSGVSGPIPSEFGDLTELRMLILHGNRLNGALPSNLGNAGKLRYLFAHGNELSGEIPGSLGNLSDLKQLRLSGNNFTGTIPVELGNIHNLRLIMLSGNSFTPQPFPEFLLPREGHNTNLDVLFLQGTNLIGELPDEINLDVVNENRFNNLRVSSNNLEGKIPNWVTEHNFIIVSFNDNNFSGDLPPGFHDQNSRIYERVRNLYFHRNNLTGPLPSVGFSPNIRFISFYQNDFTGSIPAEWGTIAGDARGDELHIRVHRNRLSGPIPVEVADLEVTGSGTLGRFQIDGNNFTGTDIEPFKTALINNHPTVEFIDGEQSLPDNGSGEDGEQEGDGDDGDGDESSNLEAPELISPGQNEQNVSIEASLFEWGDVGADYYILEVSSGGSSIETTVSSPYLEVSGLMEPETAYQWRVRGVWDDIEGDWSELWRFETEEAEEDDNAIVLEAPVLLTPEHEENVSTLKPTIAWSSVGADEYILHIYRENDEGQHVEYFLSDLENNVISDTTFTFIEETIPGRVHAWRVRGLADGEKGEWSEVKRFATDEENNIITTIDEEGPVQTGIDQNYPNPFNPSTQIEFTLAELQTVSLKVYDMAGRQVAVLSEGVKSAGRHSATFNASNLASGVYFYRLVTDKGSFTKKMTLVK